MSWHVVSPTQTIACQNKQHLNHISLALSQRRPDARCLVSSFCAQPSRRGLEVPGLLGAGAQRGAPGAGGAERQARLFGAGGERRVGANQADLEPGLFGVKDTGIFVRQNGDDGTPPSGRKTKKKKRGGFPAQMGLSAAEARLLGKTISGRHFWTRSVTIIQ